VTGVTARLSAILRSLANRRVIVIGVIAVIALGAAASVATVVGVQEEQRRELLAEVKTAASAFESQLASVSAAGVRYEADLAEAAELTAELSATLELPPQRFDAKARTAVERSVEQLETSSSLPSASETPTVAVRNDATVDELRSAQAALTDAIDALDDQAAELDGLQSGLADAVEAARSSAKTLVDGVIGGTEGILVANAAASVASSDRVRTVVAALGDKWTAAGLREWIDAIGALEVSTAEAAAAARLALEEGDVESDGADAESSAPQTTPFTDIPIVMAPSVPPPPEDPIVETPPVSELWPLLWNEYWRPLDECGTPRVVKTFPTDDFGNGLESGMSSPWSHEWANGGINVLACRS